MSQEPVKGIKENYCGNCRSILADGLMRCPCGHRTVLHMDVDEANMYIKSALKLKEEFEREN